jgi:hypothetical protein
LKILDMLEKCSAITLGNVMYEMLDDGTELGTLRICRHAFTLASMFENTLDSPLAEVLLTVVDQL